MFNTVQLAQTYRISFSTILPVLPHELNYFPIGEDMQKKEADEIFIRLEERKWFVVWESLA